MNKNTKRVLSAITVASLSVTSFTGNIQNVVNAKEDKQEENALSTNRVNAEVLENEAGAVIRVSASSNVQNVKTTYSVDSAGSKVVSFGDLKAGEVREIQVNFEEDSNKLKSLPKTTAVSDRVDFNKEVRGHKIKGSVSFEYDNGDTAPVVTPTVPTTPTKPVVTTPSNPTEPTNPVVTPTVPTTPTNPVVTTPSNPTEPTNPVVTPTVPTKPINPNAKKVNLNVNVHVILRGQPRVFTVGIYENVDAGTKVTLEHVREVLKQYNFEADKLEGFPAVLDKDYTVDVDAISTKEPAKPVTPVVTPADTGLEAGMPANVKWSRAQLKEWGFTFGKITGNYDVDGDLGVFDNEDVLDPAYRSGRAHMLDDVTNGKMDFEDFKNNTPHGYSGYSVTKPDGTKGYNIFLYDKKGIYNDGQKAR